MVCKRILLSAALFSCCLMTSKINADGVDLSVADKFYATTQEQKIDPTTLSIFSLTAPPQIWSELTDENAVKISDSGVSLSELSQLDTFGREVLKPEFTDWFPIERNALMERTASSPTTIKPLFLRLSEQPGLLKRLR